MKSENILAGVMVVAAAVIFWQAKKRSAPLVINGVPRGVTSTTAQVLGDYSGTKFASLVPLWSIGQENPAPAGIDMSRLFPLTGGY